MAKMDMVGNIAKYFGFPPSDLWKMDIDELLFWNKELIRLVKAEKE